MAMANGEVGNVMLGHFFDVKTSYGGLKISEFNQEFISEV